MDSAFKSTNALLRFLLHGEKYRQNDPDIMELAQEAKDRVSLSVKNAGMETKLGAISGIFVTLVPVQTVGVQGDGRSYSYLCALSGEENWPNLFFLAKPIPEVQY